MNVTFWLLRALVKNQGRNVALNPYYTNSTLGAINNIFNITCYEFTVKFTRFQNHHLIKYQ